ncbi:MAG TPA: YkvA family protein [Gemmatimonadaceae bacterium]|nr:YkvA family protein [Gemmatimonadaceae bacterium]
MKTQSSRASAAASARKRRSRTAGTARSASKPRETAEPAETPRTGAKRTVMGTMKELPNFMRLLGGLITDMRVSTTDKLLVAGAVAYILLPMDFIPDFIPFLGEVDDIFLLVLALQRLIANAGRAVVQDHWMGDPKQLGSLDLERTLAAAAFFLPRRIRRRLKTIGRDY